MLYTYVPSLVKCYIFGVELKGLSKDSIVTIERLNEVNVFRKAQDGSSVAFVDNVASYRVTINVEQVSQSNDFLHTIFKLHQRVGENIKIPLFINEDIRNGGTKFTAFDCFFESEPTTEFGSASVTKQWTFICNNAAYTLKGTTDSSMITDSLRATIRMIDLAQSAGIDMSNIEGLIRTGVEDAQRKLKELF